MPAQPPLAVALIGCGDVSSVHVDAATANPDARIVAVCDVDEGRRTATAQRLGCAAYADHVELLDAVAPDVVHICTPHHLHAEMAVQCLARGISVLLEKPLATTVADGQRVVEAALASTAIVGVCFQNRYNHTARTLRSLLDAGTLGAPTGGRASVVWHRDADYYRRRDWRGRLATAGGGVLINQAIHTLDLLQWYLGPPEQVRGQASTLSLAGVIEVEDTAVIQLRHRPGPAGPVGSVFYATNGHLDNAPVTVELHTEQALVRLHTDLTINYQDGRVQTITEPATASGARAYWGLSHGLLIDDFYRHVRARRPFWIDAAEAMHSLRTVTAVYDQSADRHR